MENVHASVVLTVKTKIYAPIETVWDALTNTKHIQQWNFAHESWHCPKAVNKLAVGGMFSYRMEAKDGSAGFDLEGKFDKIEAPSELEYTLADGRKVKVSLEPTTKSRILVVQSFEAEESNSLEDQQKGWQSTLDNLNAYAQNL